MFIHVHHTHLSAPVAELPVAAENHADAGGIHELQAGKIQDEPTDGAVGDQAVQLPADALGAVVIQLAGQADDHAVSIADRLQHIKYLL